MRAGSIILFWMLISPVFWAQTTAPDSTQTDDVVPHAEPGADRVPPTVDGAADGPPDVHAAADAAAFTRSDEPRGRGGGRRPPRPDAGAEARAPGRREQQERWMCITAGACPRRIARTTVTTRISG